MRFTFRTLVVSFGLALLGGPACGPSNTILPPDECDGAPTDAAVTSLELGGPSGGSFLPVDDADIVTPEYGSQGGTMLPLRIRLRGDAVPACVAQRVTIADAVGNVYLDQTTPLRTYANGEAARTTRPHFPIFDAEPDPGDWITLTVEAARQSAARSVWYVQPYEGPELTGLVAPETVAVGESFELGVTLDGPMSSELPIVLSVSDPTVVELPTRFYVAPTGVDIRLPAQAVGSGEVEIRAASGQLVQSARVTVMP